MSKAIRNFFVESWTYFMVGIKQQASLIIVTTLFSMVIPLGVILMIFMMPIDINNETAIIYISGNIVTAISNLCITTLAQILISIRARNGFEHMATLPIYRWSPLVGMFCSSAISTIPSLLIMPFIGIQLFHAKIQCNLWLILIVFMSIVTMAGIGAIAGTCSDNYEVSNTVSMVMMFFVMFGTPVYYSIDSLPTIIKVFQRLLPFCYSLEAMRNIMMYGSPNAIVYRDIAILAVFMLVSLILTSRFFNWKQRK